jgi:predicted metal-dependent HD superfamily phosphohydrolase
MLGDTLIALCGKYTNDTSLIDQLWAEIKTKYSGKKRHYHNLDHLSNMLTHLEACRHLVTDWDGVLFALFYHDLVYDPTSKDNEEKSAVEAEKKLDALGVPIEKIRHVVQLIVATKSHNASPDADVNLFTDADLSILGSPEAEYEQYCSNVRKEYSIYPDILYKPGRRKVLQHFLEMKSIFKTGFFATKFESAARINITNELKLLSN